jgi:hypothetical protein
MDYSIELDFEELGLAQSALSPESELWVTVIMLTLEDLDVVSRYLHEELLPLQRDTIVECLTKNLIGRQYWLNRLTRERVRKEKAICKREIYILSYCIRSDWFATICDFIGVNHSFIVEVSEKILTRKLGRVLSKNTLELKLKLKPRRARGRKKRTP